MIVANLATYPARQSTLRLVVNSIAPQVDVLNIVLNQYDKVPEVPNFPKQVRFVVPSRDLKDTGKFLPKISSHDYAFLLDDDIIYPPDYVAKTIRCLEQLGNRKVVVGYHGSIYFPRLTPGMDKEIFLSWQSKRDLNNPIQNRIVLHFQKQQKHPTQVHQLGTGVCAMRGACLPPFEFMSDSQKFVDVRFARWAFEQKIPLLCLARNDGWIKELQTSESIYRGFTLQAPPNVIEEIRTYARDANSDEPMLNAAPTPKRILGE